MESKTTWFIARLIYYCCAWFLILIFLFLCRWRGENVSTVEVESVISSVLEQVDSVVYGVDVPGVEGKAGMAAIVEDAAKFDLDSFLKRLKAELPSYAIPLFVRLVNTLDITGIKTKKKIMNCLVLVTAVTFLAFKNLFMNNNTV